MQTASMNVALAHGRSSECIQMVIVWFTSVDTNNIPITSTLN